jgi:hypothetical protein
MGHDDVGLLDELGPSDALGTEQQVGGERGRATWVATSGSRSQ